MVYGKIEQIKYYQIAPVSSFTTDLQSQYSNHLVIRRCVTCYNFNRALDREFLKVGTILNLDHFLFIISQ